MSERPLDEADEATLPRHWPRVPHPVASYALLSLLDYGFSIVAFKLGYEEANPILAWYKERGLFGAVKIGTILAVAILGTSAWRFRAVRLVIYLANALMVLVVGYHLFYWIQYLRSH